MHGGGIQYENFTASGGWVSTPVDLLRFARGILSNNSPLSANARAMLAQAPGKTVRDGRGDGGWPYGNAGFSIYRTNPAWRTGSLGKGGSVTGARAYLEFSEDGVPAYGFALTVNYDVGLGLIRNFIITAIQQLNNRPQEQQNLGLTDFF